ncbi:MAG: hypothetical protein P4L49_13230 [Desulfosporosinus sp.]|nr:hypothetical protein [Desulfosporosinus sp.]
MADTKKSSLLPTREMVEKFDMLSPMLDSALSEMREFSKKKQDGVLNPLKVKLINHLLNDIKTTLSSDASTEYLDVLDEETLPQNSDAVLILGQFRAAMDQFRGKYYGYDSEKHDHRWFTQENPGKLKK